MPMPIAASVAVPQQVMSIPGPFEMPEPPTLSKDSIRDMSQECSMRLFDSHGLIRKSAPTSSSIRELGLQKLIGTSWDKETWTALITRLASRGLSSTGTASKDTAVGGPAEIQRGKLFSLVMSNFRDNIDLCASWLTEEWYTGCLDSSTIGSSERPYSKWCTKILDAIIPYLESKDRLFMRFLSDLPELDSSMISKLRLLCVDPDRSQLGYTTLQ